MGQTNSIIRPQAFSKLIPAFLLIRTHQWVATEKLEDINLQTVYYASSWSSYLLVLIWDRFSLLNACGLMIELAWSTLLLNLSLSHGVQRSSALQTFADIFVYCIWAYQLSCVVYYLNPPTFKIHPIFFFI